MAIQNFHVLYLEYFEKAFKLSLASAICCSCYGALYRRVHVCVTVLAASMRCFCAVLLSRTQPPGYVMVNCQVHEKDSLVHQHIHTHMRRTYGLL